MCFISNKGQLNYFNLKSINPLFVPSIFIYSVFMIVCCVMTSASWRQRHNIYIIHCYTH